MRLLTPVHGVLAAIYLRSTKSPWTPREQYCIVAGSMIPDIPINVGLCWAAIRYFHRNPHVIHARYVEAGLHTIVFNHARPIAMQVIQSDLGYYFNVMAFDRWFHVAAIWFLLILAGLCIRRWRSALCALAFGALIFHLPVDAATHTLFRRPYLLPFLRNGFPGLTSEGNFTCYVLQIIIAGFGIWILLRKSSKACRIT